MLDPGGPCCGWLLLLPAAAFVGPTTAAPLLTDKPWLGHWLGCSCPGAAAGGAGAGGGCCCCCGGGGCCCCCCGCDALILSDCCCCAAGVLLAGLLAGGCSLAASASLPGGLSIAPAPFPAGVATGGSAPRSFPAAPCFPASSALVDPATAVALDCLAGWADTPGSLAAVIADAAGTASAAVADAGRATRDCWPARSSCLPAPAETAPATPPPAGPLA